ncbi:CpsB/CapC family capsule biosynthesis tyrosine phosphatase [Bacillaceae bacterium S4-13-58]
MIDIHCHILPELDDGAQTLEDSLEMARAAVQEGIHTIIATPHHMNGKYINLAENVIKEVSALNLQLKENNIPLTILPGQETRINGEMINNLQRHQLLPLNQTSSYVFVELPSDHVPRYTTQLLFDIQLAGYRPIIVHPERNQQLIQNPDVLYKMVEKGTLTQVTAASVTGKFGKNIQKFTQKIIEANLTHFIASDAHNTTTRRFCLSEAYEEIRNRYGEDFLHFFMENAELILENQTVVGEPPEKIGRKKILGIF